MSSATQIKIDNCGSTSSVAQIEDSLAIENPSIRIRNDFLTWLVHFVVTLCHRSNGLTPGEPTAISLRFGSKWK
jgi:hypothetical protein